MMKKVLFFLTFLLTTLGGGNSAWADAVTFNTTSGNLTTPQDDISLTYSGPSLQSDNLKVSKGQSFTISSSTRFIQSVVMTLRNKDGNEVYATQYVTANVGSTQYVDDTKTYSWTGIAKTIVFSNADVNGARDFRPISITVTYTTTDPSSVSDETIQTYPYTWNFNSSATQWTSSLEQLSVFTNEWSPTIDETHHEYRPLISRSNWGYNIDVVKGLKFVNTTENLSPCLDYRNGLIYVFNGTGITISSVKAGQKISVTGYELSVSAHTNTTAQTETANQREYIVDANGDVTLTFGTCWITMISVQKTDVTLSVRQSSQLNKKVGDNYDYFKVDVTPVSARTGNNGLFSVTSNSNSSVMNVETWGGTENWYSYKITPGVAGTADVVLHYAGNDIYNPADLEVTFTVNKASQTLSFAESSKTISYDDAAPTNALTHSVGDGTVTYSSSDTHVATVDASTGALTIHNAGTCIITATAAETTTYAETSTSYTLTVNATQSAPTITMTQNPETSQAVTVANGGTVNTTYGNTVTVRGTCSISGPTVKYSSSNTSVATVNSSGVVTTVSGGTVTITVYTESYLGYPAASVSYTLNINPSSFELKFLPSEGYVNVGATITPQMSLPTLVFADVTSITASSDNTSIATVPTNLMLQDGSSYPYLEINEGKVNRFLPIITGVAEGTTTIRVRFVSNNYTSTEATYTIHVTAAGTRNFSWADGSGTPTYTMYKGDYMKLPKITGNSNGNDSYSNGANLKYVYYIERQKDKVTWNKDSYKRYEGTPNIDIVDGETTGTLTDHAIVFFAKGQSSSGVPDTLFVFAKEVGTVTIRATDPQNSSLYCDATLNIIDKASTIDTDASSQISTMSFPYTWDFTGDFDMTDITANSHYWERYDGHYSAGDGFFNVDWADIDSDNNYNERCFKHFIAGAPAETRAGNYMPLFYGMEMSLQSSGYAPKIDRVSIRDYNSANPGAARFVISGGTTQIRLPKVTTQPGSYRIYMKIRTADKTVVEVVGGSKKYASNTETSGYTDLLDKNSDAIIFFDVTNTSGSDAGSVINFDNTTIYWIACSTEAKNLSYFKHSNSHLTYAAAAYSYPEDLDLSKSNEVNGATAYYAGSFNLDNDAQGAYSNEQEQQYAVVMKPLTNLGTYVKAGTGMLLKYDDLSGIDVSENDATIPFHMIANPKNVETYSAAETVTGEGVTNYLVGTGASSTTISGHETIESVDYTNFMMSAAYKYYTDITDASTAQGGYRFDRDWSFYPVMNTGPVDPQKSYLHIPANLYVDKNGKIVDMPSSSRRTAGGSAEAPASKAALAIVFDDELSNGQGTTGISTVATETTADSDAWYTLQGVRVETPTKGGIYIHKGRKIVVK